jgi:hypothetical protein
MLKLLMSKTWFDQPVTEQRPRDPSDLDTVVVPAHEDGFKRVFLGENRWWAVRIHPSMVKQLKYAAVYLTATMACVVAYFALLMSAIVRQAPEFAFLFRWFQQFLYFSH